jgi:putative RNA 2'-phosphotransferase
MEDQSKKLTRISKFLSKVLRHDPGYLSLDLDDAGWVPVTKLLKAMKEHRKAPETTLELLQEVVRDNNKKRFEFNTHGDKIRARQGHSVQVELGYEPIEPPECLFHGTAEKTLPAIRSGGLLKMNRHAVHLSKDHDTAYKVGMRHGKPVILQVEAQKMHNDGHKFFLTENDVWYTEHVPTDFLVYPGERHYHFLRPAPKDY